MAEQLGVDGAFRNSAAVHRYVAAVLARAVGVYYLGKELLARAAFTRHEYRQVYRCHLQCALHGGKKHRGVAHYSEPLLDLHHLGGDVGGQLCITYWHKSIENLL